jgi:hypothetical protein
MRTERKNKPACVPTSARDDTSRRARTLPSRYMPSLLVPIPSPARASRAASLGSVETRRVSRRVARIASASSSSSDEISSRRRDRNPAATRLRELLAGPDIVQTPCAHDALSASLIERAGFKAGFMSGFCVSAARLAMPDAGLISYGEMADVGRTVCEGAFYHLTLVPVRPRRRGERRSLRTFSPGVRLSSPTLRSQYPPSTPFNSASDAFQLHPDVRSYGPSTLSRVARVPVHRRRGRRVRERDEREEDDARVRRRRVRGAAHGGPGRAESVRAHAESESHPARRRRRARQSRVRRTRRGAQRGHRDLRAVGQSKRGEFRRGAVARRRVRGRWRGRVVHRCGARADVL